MRVPIPDDEDSSFAEPPFANLWAYGTYIYLGLASEYAKVQPLSIFSLITKYDAGVRSFNGNNFAAWSQTLLTNRFQLEKSKSGAGRSEEWLAAMKIEQQVTMKEICRACIA